MTQIGKLEPVELRELWRHEEYGFSAWLAGNLGELGKVLGRALSDPQREVPAGGYSVDVVAEDEGGGRVVIENQLAASDHDHLGKVITYLTNLDAKTAVWVVKEARAEHIRAMQWLNEYSPDDIAFYLVRLAAYRIGDSAPAPLFTVIVGPSVLRLRFWEQLLALAKSEGLLLHAQRSPSKEHWLGAGAGIRSGLAFNYLVWMEGEAGVELYIDTGDSAENKRIFDAYRGCQAQIENDFGGQLVWDRLDDRRACRIKYIFQCGGLVDETQWPTAQSKLVDSMRRLATSIRNSGVKP